MKRAVALGAFVVVACGVQVNLGTLPNDEVVGPGPSEGLVDASPFDGCSDDVCGPNEWDAATVDDAAFEPDDAQTGDATTD